MVVGRITNDKPDVQYYGVANKEKSIPVDASTIFEIGSISKTMTGNSFADTHCRKEDRSR